MIETLILAAAVLSGPSGPSIQDRADAIAAAHATAIRPPETSGPSRVKLAAPYAGAYAADWVASHYYMRQWETGWKGHEANPFARTTLGRAACGVLTVAAATEFDYRLRRAGHKRWARAYRLAFVGLRLWMVAKNTRGTR
jgi:hypothetical protein